ncbi:hypothetical protein V8E36_009060, partial [Tilletia maclaganii]
LRYTRSHRTPKYSLPQLVSVLESGLQSETASLRFDYVSMHNRCIRALRAVRAASHDYLTQKHGPHYLDDESQLPFVVGWILQIATLSGRAFEISGMRKELREEIGSRGMRQVSVGSKLLVGATGALADFLRSTGEGDAE